jgi:hypothetical protein
MLYQFLEDQRHTGHIELVYRKQTNSDEDGYKNWVFTYIYDSPHLKQYIRTAIEMWRANPVSPDHSIYTVEGILREGYIR